MNFNEKMIDIITNPQTLDSVVSREVHPRDGMYVRDRENHYFSCGREAVARIAGICALNNSQPPLDILDFACGFGRVARYLRVAFPEAKLTTSDIMKDAVDFVSNEFSSKAHYSVANLGDVQLSGTYDLIWSGSLLTHLNESQSIELFKFYSSKLKPNGLAIFTSHGRYVAKRVHQEKWPYNLSKEVFLELAQTFEAGNFAYTDYANMKGYGISIIPLPWIANAIYSDPSIRLISYIERGWDGHQDIIAIQKKEII